MGESCIMNCVLQEYYLVALSQPRAERLADLQMDAQGKSLAAKMVKPTLLNNRNAVSRCDIH